MWISYLIKKKKLIYLLFNFLRSWFLVHAVVLLTNELLISNYEFMFTAFLITMVEPTASGVFCNRMLSMVNSEDVNAIIQAQRHMCVSV